MERLAHLTGNDPAFPDGQSGAFPDGNRCKNGGPGQTRTAIDPLRCNRLEVGAGTEPIS